MQNIIVKFKTKGHVMRLLKKPVLKHLYRETKLKTHTGK